MIAVANIIILVFFIVSLRTDLLSQRDSLVPARNQSLAETAFQAISANSLPEFARILRNHRFDAVILRQ